MIVYHKMNLKEEFEAMGLRPNTVKNYISQLNGVRRVLDLSSEEDTYEWLIDDDIVKFITEHYSDCVASARTNLYCALIKTLRLVYADMLSDPMVKSESENSLCVRS